MPLRYVAGRDASNSTTTPLGANETFTGEWVQNNEEHLAFNCLADQDGTLYVEFSIDGTEVLQTLSKTYQIFANSPDFDALVKVPGRFHRVRYVNGGTAQGKFGLLVATGDALYPYAVSDRDAPAFLSSDVQNSTTEQYQMLVDLSDREQFPHHYTGRIDLYSAFFFVDKGSNTIGAVQLGIITRVDATSADITYVQGVSFNSTSDRSFARDRALIHPIRCGQSGGKLTKAPGTSVAGVTAVNTATPLETPYGTATPAVGDLIVRFAYTSGSAYNAFASIQYSTTSSTV